MDILDYDEESNNNINNINDIDDTDDDKTLILDENTEDNKYRGYLFNRYENIIKLLGLNININYPLKIIIQGIVDMHLIKSREGNRYARIYKFRDNNISYKLANIIAYSKDTLISLFTLEKSIRRIYRHYKLSSINNEINDKVINEVVGFNYKNLRWTALESNIL
jgi:hypothetical protein